MEHLGLLKQTVAYKVVKNDRERDNLSHAYLIYSVDSKYLRDYLKTFAKLILLGENSDFSRESELINKENYTDVKIIPENNKKISVADIDNLIEDSFIKPFEADKKIYIIDVETQMSAEAQNKLLKTLEEPPKNTIILIGALSEYGLLPTIKSRVKKLFIPVFKEEDIYSELSKKLTDSKKLKLAISTSDGTIGSVESLYDDKNLSSLNGLAINLINNLNKSKDVGVFLSKITALKDNIEEFLNSLLSIYKDMLINITTNGKGNFNRDLIEQITSKEYKESTLIHAIESVNETIKRRQLNANDNMTINYLLFQILEGRYKWQKL